MTPNSLFIFFKKVSSHMYIIQKYGNNLDTMN